MASSQENLQRFQAIADRGIQDQLSADKKARFDEAVRRGLIKSDSYSPSIVDQGVNAIKNVAEIGLGNLEAAGTIASGALLEPVAGIAGLVAQSIPGGKTGAEMVESVQDMAYQPKTSEGVERLSQIGSIAEYIPDIAGGAGELAYSATGSPLAASLTEGVVTVLPELLGVGALRKVRAGTRLIDDAGRPTKALRAALDKQGLVYENLSPKVKASIPSMADESFLTRQSLVPDNVSAALVEQIKSGGRDDALAGLKVVNGKVVPDNLGMNALKQGYAPGFVQSVKTATTETKSQMEKMLNIARRIKSKERVGLDIRPGDVVGESVSKRVRFIRDRANDARKELERVVNKNLSGKTIDPSIAAEPIAKTLDDLGVTLKASVNSSRPIVDFSDSILSKNTVAQKAINDMVDLLADAQKSGSVDAKTAHKVKRQLDDLIDFNKKAKDGLSEKGRSALKSARTGLNESIRSVDSNYARVNDVLSDSLAALDDFDKATGAGIDIFGRGADSAIGTKMRALMSNINSRVNLENAVNKLDDTALKLSKTTSKDLVPYGTFRGKTNLPVDLTDDIKDLAMFANAMDARFGAVAKTSFQGNIEQAINRVLNQGIAQEAIQQGAGVTAKSINKLRGINEFNAFEAMNDLLEN